MPKAKSNYNKTLKAWRKEQEAYIKSCQIRVDEMRIKLEYEKDNMAITREIIRLNQVQIKLTKQDLARELKYIAKDKKK